MGLPLLIAGAQTAWSMFQGSKQRGAYAEAVGAAGQIAGEQLNIHKQEQELESGMIQKQYEAGMEDIGFGANIELRKSQAFGKGAYREANLATSGTIKEKVNQQVENAWLKYKTDAMRQQDTMALQKEKMKIGDLQGRQRIEQARAAAIAGLDPGPTAGETAFAGLIKAAETFVT